MKLTFRKPGSKATLENVLIECTPIEALTMLDALRLLTSSEDADKDDRRLAERMVRAIERRYE